MEFDQDEIFEKNESLSPEEYAKWAAEMTAQAMMWVGTLCGAKLIAFAFRNDVGQNAFTFATGYTAEDYTSGVASVEKSREEIAVLFDDCSAKLRDPEMQKLMDQDAEFRHSASNTVVPNPRRLH